MRIGLFGGTFDPPHLGHYLAASDAFEALALDRLYFVPAAQQPLKQGAGCAPAADRLVMVARMVEDDPRFAVDPIEIERAGLSYTVDTLEAFARRSPHDERFLLVGMDVVETLDKWRTPRRIAELATVVVLRRGNGSAPVETAGIAGAVRAVIGEDVRPPVVLETRRVDLSSTEIRERLRAGRSVRGFVPDVVARYITERGLYR